MNLQVDVDGFLVAVDPLVDLGSGLITPDRDEARGHRADDLCARTGEGRRRRREEGTEGGGRRRGVGSK